MKRMYFLLAAVCLLLAVPVSHAQGSKLQNKKLWVADSLPTWEDFMGKAPKGGVAAAVTSSGVETNYFVEEGQEKIFVGAYMYREKSWAKEEYKSDSKLEHEILHFTITELFARKLRKKIYEVGSKDLKKLGDKLQDIFNKAMSDMNAYQEKYDQETSFSNNYTKQKEWKDKILAELEALKDWADPVVTFVY